MQGGRDRLLPCAPSSQHPAASCPPLRTQGALLLKHGRHGKPKVHYFRVTACDTLLRWRSAGGSLKQVRSRWAAVGGCC